MNRHALLVAGLLLIGPAPTAWAADRPRPAPNILLIVADDLGYGDLGCYGGREIPTPRLDALAAVGARFTAGYVTAPMCAASRAALLTGRYQTRFGFEFNPTGATNVAPGVGLPPEETTIAERLRDAGYATGLVGKWHLGGTAPFHPQRRGFDEFFGFLHEGHFYAPPPWEGVTSWLRRTGLPDGSQGRWISPDGRVIWSTHLGRPEPPYDADNPVMRGSQPVDERAHLTDAFAREACRFIERHRSQPWLLCLSFNAVHSPMQAADEHLARFTGIADIHRRIYAAMLSHLDDAVGRVLDGLRDQGLEENTLVVFLSDNGGPTRELTASNAPLRGEKLDLLEGGIRVPFIVAWKDHVGPRVVREPVTSLDIVATAVALAGRQQPASLDGKSLLPILSGVAEDPLHPAIYWRFGGKHALRAGRWKLLREQAGPWQLFDLDSDIGESRDLAAAEPARVSELSRLWDRWNAEQAPPRWR
jgi:arylsulfatase A-like enzyme